jgi:hypothetical protein
MSRPLACVLILVTIVLLAGSCGGGDDSSATTPAFRPEAALIRLKDLPAGWVRDPTFYDEAGDACGNPLHEQPLDSARVAYRWAPLRGLCNGVAIFAPGDAQSTMRDIASTLASKPPVVGTGRMRVRISRPRFPELGEESVPVLLTSKPDPLAGGTDDCLVAIRIGDAITFVAYAGFDIDLGEAARYAKLAAAKLAAAQG